MSAGLGEPHRTVQVINLIDTDDEDENSESFTPEPLQASTEAVPTPASRTLRTPSTTPEDDAPRIQPPDQAMPRGGMMVNIDGEEVFIPDEEGEDYVPPGIDLADLDEPGCATDMAASLTSRQVTTAEDCLKRVLEMFPEVSHDHVYKLYHDFDHEGDYETLPCSARLDNIIEQLISAPSYPKQDKGKKRKRASSQENQPDKFYEQKDRVPHPQQYRTAMQSMLKSEFPEIPVQYINDTLSAERHFYHAYVLLARIQDTSDRSTKPYGRGRPSSKNVIDAEMIATNNGWEDLADELRASRRKVATMRAERAAEEARTRAEQENLKKAIAAGETAECSACYDDLPMNRQLHCNGSVAHFTCFSCAETYIKSEVGESRCRVLCPAGCGAGFAHNQLDLLADKALLEKLAQIQQEKDIRDAGLDNLEECPFCDYKAILPPVDEDFEFRCANPDCEKVSCRRCKAISHVPVSCEQHAKDNKLNGRHVVEEAMTAALIRSCNKCKKQFIKEYGCNKMTCSSCGNLQCYVCSASVKNYDHFNQNYPDRGAIARPAPVTGKQEKCPLYDNVEERHDREVKEAEAAARAQVVEDNPDVAAEDLEIRVSDAVKKATEERLRHAADDPEGIRPLGGYRPPFGVFNMAMPDEFPLFGGEDERAPGVNAHPVRNIFEVRDAMVERLARLNGVNDRLAQLNGVNIAIAQRPVGPRPPAPGPVPVRGYIPVLGYPAAPVPPVRIAAPAPPAAPQPPPPPPQQPVVLNPPRPHGHPFLPPEFYPQPFDPFANPNPNALDVGDNPWRDIENGFGVLNRDYDMGFDGAGGGGRGGDGLGGRHRNFVPDDRWLGQDPFDAYNDNNLLGVHEAGGLLRLAKADPRPRVAFAAPPARIGIGIAQNRDAAGNANPARREYEMQLQLLLQQQQQQNRRHQQVQQRQPAFQPNVRQHRQAFRDLEHLRTDYDRAALDREAERRLEARQQMADRQRINEVQQMRHEQMELLFRANAEGLRMVEDARGIHPQVGPFDQTRDRGARNRR